MDTAFQLTNNIIKMVGALGHFNAPYMLVKGFHYFYFLDSPLSADLWLLNSCTVKGPSEDSLNNSIRKGKELGKPLVITGCVPQGQRKHSDVQGLSVVGVSLECLLISFSYGLETCWSYTVCLLSVIK